ncbi:hypothetical protein [Alicyclobacillus fodiniaquatilis]|uniref:DUF1450 domain-containing protein n=1 Tax=Alicyclobacillus fodiniaquatilis TaxID=1661150 RepID=A0ABW4JC79_9BACL
MNEEPIQICISNAVRHQLVETLKRLIGEGYPIKVEKCMDLCGSCRYSPQFVYEEDIYQVKNHVDLETRIRQLLSTRQEVSES